MVAARSGCRLVLTMQFCGRDGADQQLEEAIRAYDGPRTMVNAI